MKSLFLRSGYIFAILAVIFLSFHQKQLYSTPPQKLKVTLSNPQLSYFAILSAGNSANDTNIRIGTAGPSKSTANLFVGDTLSIGVSGSTLVNYIVRGIGTTNVFNTNVGVSAANLATGAVAIASRTATHTLTYNPTNSITSGRLQYLIRASSTAGENASDSLPDQNGFDLGGLLAGDVTCPFGSASVGTTTVVTYSNPPVTQSFHVIECILSAGSTSTPIGAGSTGVTTTLTIGSATHKLINPSRSGLTEGSSDIYTYFLREIDGTGTVIERTTGKLAVIENVRITATVDPTLTFTIDNNAVGIGGTPCGLSAFGNSAANTTATTVAFGSLNLGAFNDLAHHLSCVTNADNGYAVTVQEFGPMYNTSSGTTIPDTNCDGSCTTTNSGAWSTDNSHSEWGYTIHNVNVGVTSMHYTQGYRPFALSPVQIMSNSVTPVATEQAYICYRLTASTTQEAGNYENHLIFTATATF